MRVHEAGKDEAPGDVDGVGPVQARAALGDAAVLDPQVGGLDARGVQLDEGPAPQQHLLLILVRGCWYAAGLPGTGRGEGARLALAIALSLSTWASAFVGARYALRSYTPGAMALGRFLAASCGFAVVALVLRRRWRWPPRADLGRLLLSGCIGNAVYHLALNAGQRTVTAAVASVLVATSPVFTALLARGVLGERLGAAGWAGIALSFAGTLLIAARHGAPLDLEPAAGFVLLAALAQAAAFILVKPPLARASGFTVTAVTVWAGTLCLLVFAPDLWAGIHAAPRAATLTLVYLGLVPGFLGALAFAYVLARMPASRAAPLLYAVPPLTLALGFVLLGETTTATAVAGAIVTLAGVAVVSRSRRA